MARRSYRPEQIINKLMKVELFLSQGTTVSEAAGKIGVSEQTILSLMKGISWDKAWANRKANRT